MRLRLARAASRPRQPRTSRRPRSWLAPARRRARASARLRRAPRLPSVRRRWRGARRLRTRADFRRLVRAGAATRRRFSASASRSAPGRHGRDALGLCDSISWWDARDRSSAIRVAALGACSCDCRSAAERLGARRRRRRDRGDPLGRSPSTSSSSAATRRARNALHAITLADLTLGLTGSASPRCSRSPSAGGTPGGSDLRPSCLPSAFARRARDRAEPATSATASSPERSPRPSRRGAVTCERRACRRPIVPRDPDRPVRRRHDAARPRRGRSGAA